jgi:glutamate-ammonia-ligase adenylyltransferase
MLALVRDLPDPEGAQLFFERISREHPRAARILTRDPGLLADVLALAAWSQLLATTLAQNPDYLTWLARERVQSRVKTGEELLESLARFALTNSQLETPVLLARFRRRELLRIYLRDIRRTATLVETTEELSNLADAVLQYALRLARQDLDNLYGQPLRMDERGRAAEAHFCIVALGKLGSNELNYASDIDLLFLYSDDGMTSGAGTRGSITNREYFVKLASAVTRMVGHPAGEGAAYRVDLRLRPHGRDGALSCSLSEAVRYYRETAHDWERQALIRARAAAGSAALYTDFATQVREAVYRPTETVARALRSVRLAKQKIDKFHRKETGGYNVKLGRGGIREIEFIAQALQLAYGGRDPWLRAPHTLISLGRLAERGFITEQERGQLAAAYDFLRRLEHRLQMEHGLQTHTVPEEPGRRALVARRMGFAGASALADFDRALEMHTANVRAAYERVFAFPESSETTEADHALAERAMTAPHGAPGQPDEPPASAAEMAAARAAAEAFVARFGAPRREAESVTAHDLAGRIREMARRSLNPQRALIATARVAASLSKSSVSLELSEDDLAALVRLCGASEMLGEMIASNPSLISVLAVGPCHSAEPDYAALLQEAVRSESSFGGKLAALRRAWARLLVGIGALDVAGTLSLRESNRRQTELAAASLDAGFLIAQEEMARRYGPLQAALPLAVLGLGRLGGGGLDYGSDLDVVFIYDDAAPPPLASLTHHQAYGLFSELLVTALSSVTRDGYLYRVDLRLRPYGKNGATVTGARAFIEYLRERAAVWEWLAYVKLRAAAGDLELGKRVEREARRAIHETARRAPADVLRDETRRVRDRLEHERARRAPGAIDIKFGAGGMLDVYFAVRYLQLRDDVPDEDPDRSTRTTLMRLQAAGSLSHQDYRALDEGYALLRALDHHLRLVVGRSTLLPAVDHPAFADIARSAGYASIAELTDQLAAHMKLIRAAYDRIMN